MELRKETNEKFGTIRLTKDNNNPKVAGDMLYCINDICKTLNIDLEWACDAMGRGFVFEYTFDNETLRFTMHYAIGRLFDHVCTLTYNGELKNSIDDVKEYLLWLYQFEHDWIASVEPSCEKFLTKEDVSIAYEIEVIVQDKHGQITKTTNLDMFSNRETANQFIREYNKRVTGWELEETKPMLGASMSDGVELCRHNPDGTKTRMLVKPHTVFNSWDAYKNENAVFIRKCDLKF